MANTVKVALTDPASSRGAYDTIEVQDGSGRTLEISLRRTVRVPDNCRKYNLPPDCGPFPLYLVAQHSDKLPANMAAKGGVFLPIYRKSSLWNRILAVKVNLGLTSHIEREAMWIDFSADLPFAVKVFVGGVNAISGVSKKNLNHIPNILDQDYLVADIQDWLDGIANENGKVSQFVATSRASGYSVEAQVDGVESIGGLQLEIIPLKPDVENQDTVSFNVKDLTGRVYPFTVPLRTTVEELKYMVMAKQGYPPDQQRLIFGGKQLEDRKLLD